MANVKLYTLSAKAINILTHVEDFPKENVNSGGSRSLA